MFSGGVFCTNRLKITPNINREQNRSPHVADDARASSVSRERVPASEALLRTGTRYCREREFAITLQNLEKLYEKVEHHTSKLEKPARNIGGESANICCPFFDSARVNLTSQRVFKSPHTCIDMARC